MPELKFIFLFTFSLLLNHAQAQVVNGVADAGQLKRNEKLVLKGTWEFYPHKFLTHEDFRKYPSRNPHILNVPSTWNSQNLPAKMYGTYKVRLRNLPVNELLGISIPNVYSSYRLYIDNQLLSENGAPGTSQADTKPQWLMKTVAFKPASSEADIIIHIANFHHSRGGIHKNIVLGKYEELQNFRESELLSQMVIFSGLVVLGLFFLGMYFVRSKNGYLQIIFFALLCLSWAGRIFFAHIYLRSFFFPDMDWVYAIKLEYILLYVSLIFGNLFLYFAFDIERNLLFRSLLIINVIFILLTLALPPLIFTSLLPGFLGLAFLNMGHILYATIYAVYKSRPSAWYAVGAVTFGVCLFMYEIMAYQLEWTLNHLFLQGSYLIVFLINSFVLANEFSLQEKKIEELEKKRLKFFNS